LLNLVKLGREFQFAIYDIDLGAFMIARIACMVGLLVLTTSVSASAAVVKFMGTLTSKSSGLTLPLGGFEGELTVNNSVASFSSIASGKFVFGGTDTLLVTGGIVNVTGAGQILFSIGNTNFNPVIGQTLTFIFTGVPGVLAGSPINQATLDNLHSPTSLTASTFSFTDGSLTYNGSITAVPEPGSMALVASLVLGAGGWKWRKRKLAAAKQA
jgi:hypothetical protein